MMNKSSDKIKVLTVIRNPLGGIRTYIKYTYGSLDSRKYKFTILTVKEGEADSKHIREDLRGYDVDVLEVQGKKINLLFLYRIFKVLRQSNFDIIHSQGLTAGVLTVVGNLLTRVPHIIISHDVFRDDQFSQYFIGYLKKKVLSVLVGRAHFIQSVGNDAQKNLVEYLPSLIKKKDKLVVIKNGIKVENFMISDSKDNQTIRKEVYTGNNIFLFGFLGRFMKQKGFVYLIDAVENLSKDKAVSDSFKIITVNDGDYIREYRGIIKKKNLSKYFDFYGFVPDISRILRDLDAVIMPSLWEAFGLVAAEAMIMGCPIIATDCIGLREVVADTPAIVTESKNAHLLAKEMKNFIINPEPVKKSAHEFIAVARQRFDVRNTANQLDALFHQAIIANNNEELT